MVRLIGVLAGLAFVSALLASLIFSPHDAPTETAAGQFHVEPLEVSFASDGPFGKFDRRQVQRGFQVYKEVCSGCHSLRLVSFHDLEEIGFTKPEVKAIAKQWQVEQPSLDPKTGEPATRKNLPSDRFPSPYPNEVAARAANNNALPPDMSLLAKAREGGPAYIYSLVTGYRNPPTALLKRFPDAATPPGLHFNPYFANLNISMPPPLTADGQVTYADGTKATRDQMAKDVAAFLVWAAEPKLENRHSAGLATLIFLLVATTLAYFAYQNIWADRKH